MAYQFFFKIQSRSLENLQPPADVKSFLHPISQAVSGPMKTCDITRNPSIDSLCHINFINWPRKGEQQGQLNLNSFMWNFICHKKENKSIKNTTQNNQRQFVGVSKPKCMNGRLALTTLRYKIKITNICLHQENEGFSLFHLYDEV